ncbi:MAG TPA: ABC transporter permease [Longimicrobiales bacterium]
MDTFFQDIRYAARSLRRARTVSVAAFACLALGIGVNTGVFSVVNGILFRPLPFARADRVVTVQVTDAERGVLDMAVPYGDLADLRDAGVFAQVEAFTTRGFTVTDGDQAERLQGAAVTPGLFALLGVEPRLGRHFRADEAGPAGFEQAVMLSDALWRSRYNGDEGIVNRTIRLNDRPVVVAGVMPPGFMFPETERIWVPVAAADPTDRQARYLLPVARLRDDVSVADAAARLDAVSRRLAATYPETHERFSFAVTKFRDVFIDLPARRMLLLMLAAVGFVLLIACANVTNLLLARAADRHREVSVRAAIGAARGRIIRLFLTEATLLALAAGAAGVLISVWWVEATARAIPEEMAYWISFGVDRRVLAYTLLISLGTGLVFGALPALQASRIDLQTSLKETARAAGDSRPRALLRSALVTAEIALSVILLAGATLMVQSFLRLQTANAGFDHDDMLSLRVLKSGDRYDVVPARTAFYRDVTTGIAALPEVAAVAATSSIPADDGGPTVMLWPRDADAPIGVTTYASTEHFFDVLGVNLLRGRAFTALEVADTSARVAVLGNRLAARLWPAGDGIGQLIRLTEGGSEVSYEVIGIAPDLTYEEFGEVSATSLLQVHLPYARRPYRQMALLVRGRGDAAALERPVRDVVRAADPLLAPFDVLTMNDRRRYTTWPQRLFGQTFATFGAVAMLLALVGVYGVMAYTVNQRRREIGIRMAIGARPAQVLGAVVGRAARLSLVGVGTGVLGAFAVVRVLEGLIWGVSLTDPIALVAVPASLLAAALLAGYVPARRAARIDPVEALRDE